MNISAIKLAIYNWAVAHSMGATVIWANQRAPRPARPYVTLQLSGAARPMGRDELRPLTSGANSFVTTGPRLLILTVQVWGNPETDPAGDTVWSLAQQLNGTLGMAAALENLAAANIAVVSEGDVENITAATIAGMEPRATFAAVLGTAEDITDPVGYIAEFEGATGEFLGRVNE